MKEFQGRGGGLAKRMRRAMYQSGTLKPEPYIKVKDRKTKGTDK